MPRLYKDPPVLRRPRTTRLGGALALALVAGCGGAHRRLAPDTPEDMLVEVLPRGARVSLDGAPLGRGSRATAAPPAGEHVLSVEADGYEPGERALPDGDLAGIRVAVALRPSGFASARALDYDDADGLAAAAAFLEREGADRDAAEYAARAAALEPGLAVAHRVLGDALFRLGDGSRAVAAWSQYLRLSPDAPDAADVAERIDEARVDVTVR
jgi:tetratricopeptide (TPR) repeat protein